MLASSSIDSGHWDLIKIMRRYDEYANLDRTLKTVCTFMFNVIASDARPDWDEDAAPFVFNN